MSKLTDEEMRRIALTEITRRLNEADDTRKAMERAAQIIDFVHLYHFLLPHNAEFESLMLDHVKWIERKRNTGNFPGAKTIKRPVSAPKARRSEIVSKRRRK